MRLNLHFKHVTNKSISSKDFFDMITRRVKSDKFLMQSYTETKYERIYPEDLEDLKDNNVVIFDRDGGDYKAINLLTVTFFDVPADAEVHKDIMKIYGQKAHLCEVIEEYTLENGEIVEDESGVRTIN